MEKTWASGAIELLKHAESHIQLDSAFDKRIAFISIDNSVETSIKTFLSLPQKISGVKVPKKEIDEANNSFPKIVELLFKYAGDKLVGIDDGDIEHYHRIRNQLYHNGTGLGVDERYLLAYRQIAVVLLENLFDIEFISQSTEATLENLILLWNKVEYLIRDKFEKADIPYGHTYKWELAQKEGVLTREIIYKLTELRLIRNTQVHSTSENIDKYRIKLGVELANSILQEIQG